MKLRTKSEEACSICAANKRLFCRTVPPKFDERCCGQPAWNTGLIGPARRVALPTLRALQRTEGPVVVPSGSCATMMREFWPELFEGTAQHEGAVAVAGRVVELSAFLDECRGPRLIRQATRQLRTEIEELSGRRIVCWAPARLARPRCPLRFPRTTG